MADAKDKLLSEITSELSERFDYSELKEITKILLLKMEDYNTTTTYIYTNKDNVRNTYDRIGA